LHSAHTPTPRHERESGSRARSTARISEPPATTSNHLVRGASEGPDGGPESRKVTRGMLVLASGDGPPPVSAPRTRE
jgi:hypothetical protein